MASQITRLIATLSLLLLGVAPAWAGRGDIDPNYGEGGQLALGCCSSVFPLTGDRLLISERNAGHSGVHLRMVDAAGQIVPSFGDGGAVVIDSSARAPYFQARAAAIAPNGDIVFLGGQADTGEQTLLRIDSNGQPVPSFGTDGDGFVVLNITTATQSITIDLDGRILVAEGTFVTWNNVEFTCETTTRLQRLLADGQPDAAFGSDGLVEIPELNTCDGTTVFGARADGSVIVGDDDSTIAAVDAAGDIDPAFGTDGRFQVSGLASARSLLLPDGSLLVFGSSTDTGASDTVFRKYDRNGQPDLAFGSGNGSVTVDLGTAFLGESSAREVIDQLALDPDGAHVVAELSLFHADESFACSGIARLAIDGTPDATFGRNGLTCLNFYSAVIAVQSDGAPLIFLASHDFIGRLLPDNTPSPGLLRVRSGRVDVDESAGTATLAIERLAGRDGAVSAVFATTDRRVRYCNYYYHTCRYTDGAAAGSDYTATSGRLDWADSDNGERTITVSIVDDAVQENVETFGVDFSEPGGGALLFAESLAVYISDNDVAPPPPPPPPPPPAGGGGSVSWASLLALLALLFVRPRRERRSVARTAALPGLLLLVSTAAWAGRGDIDPNYGEGGRLAIGPSVPLVLPGDRLVIAEGTDQGLRIRMVDSAGRSVPTFGDDGVVLIDSSAAVRNFRPEAAALAPEGDMVFMGSMLDTQARVILRLDSDGQPLISFGDRGDGFVEPTLTAAQAPAIAVDPRGKIVLAEGSESPDGNCGSTARVQRLLANGQPDAEFGGDGIIEIPDLAIFCSDGVLVFGPRADGGVIVGNEQTIVAVDAAGNIDPTFGVNGHLDVSELDPNGNLLMPDGGLLTPDGGLLFFRSGTLTGLGDTVFWKFDRNGQLDLDFGGGTGSVTADLGAAFQEEPSSREYIGQLALDPDGEHVVAQMSLSTGSSNYSYRRILCSGIVRLSIDGSLDDGFGRNGLTCLNITFGLIAVQSDGAPLFFADNSIHRLLPDNSPSPGFLSVASSINSFTRLSESGTAIVTTVVRVAGRDGAVGVNYATVVRPGLGYPATAGSDYTATSGRLDWADGDDSPRTVTVSILEDTIDEPSEIFGVEISEPSGGVQLIGAIMTAVISDDDEASTTPPPPPGGGGSASWATALALLGLLLIRRRDFWQRAACLQLHEK